MSLQKPPKQDAPSRTIGRLVVLLVLAAVAGVIIYTSVTNQRADLTEDRRTEGLELEDTATVDGIRLNIVEDEGGPQPVVILHDFDVTGGLTLDDVSRSLGEAHHGVRIDLPGFGYSDRIPSPGPQHTVAVMAQNVAAFIQDRYPEPVLVVGVGLGGQVAAELAHTYPDVVVGVVMVDVDFESAPTFEESLEGLPWMGRAATYTWETGGRYALDNWAPHCESGGWCPTEAELAERATIIQLEGTTDSLWSFRRTPTAALAPANLTEISMPAAYVWSTSGDVSQESVDRIAGEWAGLQVFESATFAAHLEDPAAVAAALGSVTQG
ncbi:MAG TPA: alpha/beta hydrolase [Acidimicrobiia bacterium]